jgi:hypothetical protein
MGRALLALWVTPAHALVPEGCEAVIDALSKARHVSNAGVDATIIRGRHPDGWRHMASEIDGQHQRLELDGQSYRPEAPAGDPRALDQARGLAGLDPLDACERVGQSSAAERVLVGYRYEAGDPVAAGAAAARAQTWVTLWIDARTQLPARADIDGAQLQYGRVLSRPGTAPQVVLKPTGQRYLEIRSFRWEAPTQTRERR